MYVTISSEYILEYIRSNPVADYERPGKVGYETPTLAMFEFYRLLGKQGDLFTQEQYYNHLIQIWDEWFSSLSVSNQKNLRRRAYGRFYLSGVDQLYCQSILSESRLFNLVGYDQRLETSGVDVIAITRSGRRIEIACQVNTKRANKLHKKREGLIVIKKQLAGPRVGNMYFYKRSDLQPILDMGMVDMLIRNCTNSILTA